MPGFRATILLVVVANEEGAAEYLRQEVP